MMATQESLRDHPALPGVAADVAATLRACYGRQLLPIACAGAALHVSFEPTRAQRVEMQWRVRSGGLEYELQFVEPQALFDLGAVLSPGVPLALQRAAVMHAASELLRAVEQRLGARVELSGLSGAGPAWKEHECLGARLTLMPAQESAGSPPAHCALLVRALQAEGWRALRRAAQRAVESPAAHDAQVGLALHAQSVPLTLRELHALDVGDALLLAADSGAIDSPNVRPRLGQQLLPGVRGRVVARGFCITGVEAPQVATHSFAAGAPGHQPRSGPMTTLDTHAPDVGNEDHADANPLDAVQVEIEVELARLSLPLSALRSLAVGQVFETDRSVDGEGVVLWCGGQRLGVGRLVSVGDRLAVRVVALHGSP